LRPVVPDMGADSWNLVLVWVAFVIAAVGVINTGLRIEVVAGLFTGPALALMTLPFWLSSAGLHRYFVPIIALTIVAILSGVVLTVASAPTYEVISSSMNGNSSLLAGIVLSAGLLLWVRPVMAEWQIGMLFGLGLLVEATTLSAFDNSWKYQWALPATVLALSAAQALRRRAWSFLALVALMGISIANDFRSLTGVLLLGTLILGIQALPLPAGVRGMGPGRLVLLMSVIGLSAYWLFTRLALNGVLGLDTQLRTQEQALRAGSVLLGGRPEMGATAGLFLHRPEGFGAGTVLNPEGIIAAQEAMSRLNYDPDNGYVYNYMFGRNIIELHSGIGDLWALFGLPGLALALLLVWALIDALAHRLSIRSITPLQVFTLSFTLWNMFFAPLWTAAPLLSLSLGLLLVPRGTPSFLGAQAITPSSPPG
jgi:hypothetical protein